MRKIMSAIALLLYMPLSCTNIAAMNFDDDYTDYSYNVKFSGGLTSTAFASIKYMFTNDILKNQQLGYHLGVSLGSNLLSDYLSTGIEGRYLSKNACLIESKISSSTNNTTTDKLITLDNSVMTMMLKGHIKLVNFLALSLYFTGGIGGLYSNSDLTPVKDHLSQITGITDLDKLKNQLGDDTKSLFEQRSFLQNIYPAYVFGGGISIGLGESLSVELEYNYMGTFFSKNVDIPSTHLSGTHINKLSIAHDISTHLVYLGVRVSL